MKQNPLQSHTGRGAQQFSIGYEDFVKGMSTSDRINDGGFSSNSYNINPSSSLGQLASSAPASDITLTLPGAYNSFVASCPFEDGMNVASDPPSVTISGYSRAAVTTTGDFFRIKGAGFWTNPVGDTVNSYNFTYSDMVYYAGFFYATSHNAATGDNVCRWNGATTVVTDWFHTNFSHYLSLNVVHPMLVYNKNLYIADGPFLHMYDGTNYTYQLLSLASDQIITALAIDPASGKMLVATATTAGFSGQVIARIGFYDGFNPTQFQKVVIVDDIVYSIFPMGGNVYIGYGDAFGQWTGNGIKFYRQLPVGTAITKHRITNIGNNIYFVDGDGTYITCLTEILGLGAKAFSYLYKNPYTIRTLFAQNGSTDGTSILQMDYSTGLANKLSTIDALMPGTKDQTAYFYANPKYFDRPVYIRGVDLQMDGTFSSGESVAVSFLDENNNVKALTPTITSSYPYRRNRIDGDPTPTLSAQIILTIATAVPVRRVTIYYDNAE